jgi:peptidoglycan/xylan/chitin deacetylase (PgdA/CDA1 family)
MVNKMTRAERRRKRYYYPYPLYACLVRCLSMFKKIDMNNKLPVLLYHSVSQDMSPVAAANFNVLPSTFDKQMKWLYDNSYQTLTPDDLSAIADGTKKCPEKSCVLTFDDGYYNNADIVLPILKKYNFKAFFFVATSFIGETDVFPWIQTDKPLDTKDYGPMNESQLLDLYNAGMFVCSHAHSHKRLSQFSEEESEKDIIQSLNILKNILKKPTESLAYPYGAKADFNEKHRQCCQDNGCKHVFTTKVSCIKLNDMDLFALPRINILERDGVKNFSLKVQGYFDWFETFRFATLFPFRLYDRLVNLLTIR